MTIRVDLHVHAKVSKTIPFRIEAFQRTVQRAIQVGLHGFAITEHLHSPDYWQSMEQLQRLYGYSDGKLSVAPGFNVLTGTELTVIDGADIIVIGPLESLDRFDRRFSPHLNGGHFPRLADIFSPARDEGLLLIGAHPTRPGKRLVDVGPELLAQLDALEVNGKDMAESAVDGHIREWAEKTGRPVVGSSDAHLWPQVGVQRTVIPIADLTFEGLTAALSTGEVAPESTPGTRRLVRLCQTHKRLVKARRMIRPRRVPGPVGHMLPEPTAVPVGA